MILTPTIIRHQDDLRAIFERKMQERQELIDRYLVFSEEAEWSPPKDFTRTNGLLEDIRQSQLEVIESSRRLLGSYAPDALKSHRPGEPIPLPQLAPTAASPAPSSPAATGNRTASTASPSPGSSAPGRPGRSPTNR